jgi:hypothetical protein
MPSLRRTYYLPLILSLCFSAHGQNGVVGTPVIGFLAGSSPCADRSQPCREQTRRRPAPAALELRPILGIPGAARLGDPLPMPDGVRSLLLAPGQHYALAETSDGSAMAVLPLDGATPGPLASVPGALAQADLVAFSPSGNSAALYSAQAGKLQVLAGLPQAAVVVREIPLDTAPYALAVSDDAGALASAGAAGNVSLLSQDSPPQLLYSAAGPSSIAFLPANRDLVVVDQTANQVVLVQNVTGAMSPRVLATAADGIDQPTSAVALSGSILVASANNSRIWSINTQSGIVSATDLAANPNILEQLRMDGMLLFSAPDGQPAWVFAGQTSKEYFIPPAVQEVAQ